MPTRPPRANSVVPAALAILLTIRSTSATAQAWKSIGPSVPAIEGPVAVDPGSGTIYVGTFGGGVLKSTDGGLTFAQVNTGLTVLAQAITSIAMDPTNPDIVIVGTAGGGIFRTVNGGAAWTPTSDVGTNVVFVTVDPLNPQVWYAGYGIGGAASITKSVNGGMDWAKADAGVTNSTVWSIAVDPRNAGVVLSGSGEAGAFKSTNGGTSWSPLSIQPVVWSLAIDPINSDVVYAGVNGDGVLKSTDAGGTFSRIGSPEAGVVLALAVDPADPNRVYAGTISGGLALSRDGGVTWQKTGFRKGNVLSLNMTGEGDLYVGTGINGVLRSRRRHDRFQPELDAETRAVSSSTDHPGAPWSFETIATAELLAINAQNVTSVAIDPRNPDHLILGTNDGGLLGSDDGGAHWTDVGNGFLSRAARKVFYDPGNAGKLYVGSFNGGGLYSSTDNGRNWARHLFGSPTVYVWTTAVDPVSGAVYAGTRGEGLWRSTDGGATFARIDGTLMPQVRSIAFDPARPGRILVGSNTGLWRSIDGGASFKKVATPFTLSVSVDPANPDVVYAGTQTLGVYKSVDGGATFVASNTGLTNLRMSRSGLVAVDPANSARLYASTEGGGIFKSLDAGATWRAINDGLTDLTVYGLTLDIAQPNVLYACGPHGVFKTTTGGQ